MTRSFFHYPTGLAGSALLLLRLSVSAALASGTQLVGAFWAEPLVLTIAAMLAVGALTRVAGICGLAAAMLIAVDVGGALGVSATLHGLASLALSMIGAGGYSVDARIFGRRVIILELERPH